MNNGGSDSAEITREKGINMLRWNNDYNQGAYAPILEKLQETNNTAYAGYGLDDYCERAKEDIRKYLGGANADIHFMIGGTQVNYTVIAAALRPYQSVISADSGHIHVHETGAVENTGHKIEALPAKDGKITAEQIAERAQLFEDSGVKEHITQPKLVYISMPTEYGTIYSKAELEAIGAVCKKYGLYLFMDGARLGYGLGALECDVTMADLARICDAFYIGGTKCGALFGEVVVLVNDDLKPCFRSFIKQNGAMLAKGWLLGLQFSELFKDGAYFEITKRATTQAQRIRKAFNDRGIRSYIDSCTNQQFVVVSTEQMNKIGKKHIYEYEGKADGDNHIIRFCTSWATRDEDVDVLIGDIEKM